MHFIALILVIYRQSGGSCTYSSTYTTENYNIKDTETQFLLNRNTYHFSEWNQILTLQLFSYYSYSYLVRN